MEDVFRGEKQACPCFKECREFQKLLELKKSGLVVYLHRPRGEDDCAPSLIRQGEAVGGAVNPSEDVFIIYKNKNMKITASELTSEKKNISCPRCRKTFEHAQEVVQDVKSIDRKIVIGICDHCRKKLHTSEKPFCDCDQIVKKFMYVKGETKEGTKKNAKKLFPPEIGFLRPSATLKKQKNTRTYSDLQNNLGLSSPSRHDSNVQTKFYSHTDLKSDKTEMRETDSREFYRKQINHDVSSPSRHNPDVQPMFYSHTDLKLDKIEISETDSREFYRKQAVTFIQNIEPHEGVHARSPATSLLESHTSVIETYKELKEFPRPSLKDHEREEISSKLDRSARNLDDPNRQLQFKPLRTSQRNIQNSYFKPSKFDKKYVLKAENEKEKLAREEKKLQAEEKQRQALEDKKNQALQDKTKKAEEQKILTEKDKSKELESEIDGEPVDAKVDTKSISSRQRKPRSAGKKKGDDGEAENDAEDLGTIQKEKRKIGKGTVSGLNKQAECDKILQVKKERLEMEAFKKQTKKEKQEKERLEMEALKKHTKEEKQDKDATFKKAKLTKKSGRDSSDETNLAMPKIQESVSKEINEFSVKKTESKRKSSKQGTPTLIDTELQRLKAELLREKEVSWKAQKGEQQQAKFCPLCLDSELDLDVSLEMKKNPPKQKTDIIIGEQILKCRPRLEKTKKLEDVPIFFQKEFIAEPDHRTEEEVQIIPEETKPVQNKHILRTHKRDTIKVDPGTGVIRYALSDRTFVDKGWTIVPTEKVVRKLNVYRMRPAHPEFNWFEHNKNKRLMTYDTGERLAEFDDNGRGRWYYRSGRLALDYYDAEETNVQQRFVIYSIGEPDERGRTHPITILASFDYLGNGIVFDHAGKIRLKYNQTEGVVLDRAIGPSTHWQWHSLNDPPVLQQVMIETQLSYKDPNILNLGSQAKEIPTKNADMLAIECDNLKREKTKKLSQKFRPFQIKMKAMKINEHFSLKILDQATIYLIYRDGTTNMKLNIGMLLDDKEIVDTDTTELGKVSNSLERFPARTDSLAILQANVAYSHRYERKRINRERALRPQEPCANADILAAAASPPMRLPLITVSTGSSSSTGQCTGLCSRETYRKFVL